jgi:hypothetical protein
MDTAMFYPAYLNLTQQQAISRFETMIDFAAHHGGTLIVNWHDRSLAPERLWSESYKALIHNIEQSGGWFATLSATKDWFEARRSLNVRESCKSAIASEIRFKESWQMPGFFARHYTSVLQSDAGVDRPGTP